MLQITNSNLLHGSLSKRYSGNLINLFCFSEDICSSCLMTPSTIKTNGINIVFQSGGRTECDKGIKLDKVITAKYSKYFTLKIIMETLNNKTK